MPTHSIPPLPRIEGVRVKQIERWPGYAVSDDGRVFSCKIRSPRGQMNFLPCWRELKPGLRNKGKKLGVNLCDGTRIVSFSVHTLVLTTFVGPCPIGMEICHWNDDGTDNRLANLRWDTFYNNRRDMVRNNRSTRGTRNPMALLTPALVRDIRSLAGVMTHEQIGRKFGIARRTVGEIVCRARWGWLP